MTKKVIFRFYAKDRVDVIVNIANWPVDRIEHWYTLLKARAIENQAFVIAVNRVGRDKANKYPGMTSAFDPSGREIFCIKNKQQILVADIFKRKVSQTRNKFPFLWMISLRSPYQNLPKNKSDRHVCLWKR